MLNTDIEAESDTAPTGGFREWRAFVTAAAAAGVIAAIGSLSWKPLPGTERPACGSIEGFRKDFNTRVARFRGTAAAPGVVLGLEPDRRAVADAVLLRVLPGEAPLVWQEFSQRELHGVDYVPTLVPVRRRDTGAVLVAAALLVDTRSAAYLRAPPDETAAMIRAAAGSSGSNLEYARQCLAMDRAMHGDLPAHLAALEAHLDMP